MQTFGLKGMQRLVEQAENNPSFEVIAIVKSLSVNGIPIHFNEYIIKCSNGNNLLFQIRQQVIERKYGNGVPYQNVTHEYILNRRVKTLNSCFKRLGYKNELDYYLHKDKFAEYIS